MVRGPGHVDNIRKTRRQECIPGPVRLSHGFTITRVAGVPNKTPRVMSPGLGHSAPIWLTIKYTTEAYLTIQLGHFIDPCWIYSWDIWSTLEYTTRACYRPLYIQLGHYIDPWICNWGMLSTLQSTTRAFYWPLSNIQLDDLIDPWLYNWACYRPLIIQLGHVIEPCWIYSLNIWLTLEYTTRHAIDP